MERRIRVFKPRWKGGAYCCYCMKTVLPGNGRFGSNAGQE
jgi:hypothetical protein